MPILQVYVHEDTLRRLREIGAELGRDVEELAEAAVSEEVCKYDRDNPESRP